jgi:hypothetical protein
VAQYDKLENRPARDPDEHLARIRAGSTRLHEWDSILSSEAREPSSDGYGGSEAADSDTRWLLRYVEMLREDNEKLRKHRRSFEHKVSPR